MMMVSQSRLRGIFYGTLCMTLATLAISWNNLSHLFVNRYYNKLSVSYLDYLGDNTRRSEELPIVRNSDGMSFNTLKEFRFEPHVRLDTRVNELASAEAVQRFLNDYEEKCEETDSQQSYMDISSPKSPYCPCIPENLKGRFPGYHTIRELSSLLPELEKSYQYTGGVWLPSSCAPRQVVALLVPYRDRGQHLRVFLNVLHRHLQKQLLGYKIILINQKEPKQFNRAILLNIGFLELMSRIRNISCIILHDVDLLPEDDYNFYTCDQHHPRHMSLLLDKMNYSTTFYGFGGASSLTPEHFRKVNGFSTQYYGWGGEDDDLLRRIEKAGLSIRRFPDFLTTYTSLMHMRDAGNEENQDRFFLKFTSSLRMHYGLNTTVYKIVDYQDSGLYTNISVTFPSKADTLDRDRLHRGKHGVRAKHHGKPT